MVFESFAVISIASLPVYENNSIQATVFIKLYENDKENYIGDSLSETD